MVLVCFGQLHMPDNIVVSRMFRTPKKKKLMLGLSALYTFSSQASLAGISYLFATSFNALFFFYLFPCALNKEKYFCVLKKQEYV